MGVIENAISMINQIQEVITTDNQEVIPFVEDLKRAEMRLGISPDGAMPSYKSDGYYAFKKTLSTYKGRGSWDLFLSGALHKGIKANYEDGIIHVGNSNESPDYASKFTEQTEGVSKRGASNIVEKIYIQKIDKISTIING